MTEAVKRLQELDLSLFDSIPSQTSHDDRTSLLLLQRCIRNTGDYAYFEIGSHLGGTIQPLYLDPVCTHIYSIDKRPDIQPDERGKDYKYVDNSSKRMMENLNEAFPDMNLNKISIFDCDASEVDTSKIQIAPKLCFIDGEHTNTAVYSDFISTMKVCDDDAIIAFHDSGYIYKGIEQIKEYLDDQSITYKGYMLGGCVYSIFLNNAAKLFEQEISSYTQDETAYFAEARSKLRKIKLKNKIKGFFRSN